MHFVEVGGREPVVAPLVQRQSRVDDSGTPFDRLDDLFGAGHLGDARGVDETDRLDPGDAGRGQPVDELGADRRLEHQSIGLQAVSRRDVADRDRGCSHQMTPSSRSAAISSSERPSRPPYTSALWLPSSHVADQRTAPGRARQLRDDPWADVGAEFGIDMLEEHLACLVLRIVEDVGDRVDRTADDAGVVEDAVDLRRVVLCGPIGHDPFDLVLIVSARQVGREAGVVRELGSSDRLAEPSKDVVGIRGDDHPTVVP